MNKKILELKVSIEILEMRKALPVNIEEGALDVVRTSIDFIEAEQIIRYSSTVNIVAKEEFFDENDVNNFVTNHTFTLVTATIQYDDFAIELLNNDFTFHYKYLDKQGINFATVVINKRIYDAVIKQYNELFGE